MNEMLKATNKGLPTMFKFVIVHGKAIYQDSEVSSVIQELLIERFKD